MTEELFFSTVIWKSTVLGSGVKISHFATEWSMPEKMLDQSDAFHDLTLFMDVFNIGSSAE